MNNTEEFTSVSATAERLRLAVHPDRGSLPSFIFTDASVYQAEQRQIFLKAWLFLGHETEIPQAGDYVVREMGEQSVIVTRGTDGKIRAFLNFCRHRGMPLCRVDGGRAQSFACPYHGFSYRLDGSLIGVPFQKDSYGPALDKSSLSLIEARVDTYHGLIFGTWDASAPSLNDYLGDSKWYLDLVVHHAEMEVVGPPQRWVVESNWKLAGENFMDSYHLMYAHGSVGRLGIVPSGDHYKNGYQVATDQGHGLNIGAPSQAPIYPQAVAQDFPRFLTQEQSDLLRRMNNLNGTLFPNLSIQISSLWVEGRQVAFSSLRQWQPRGVDHITVYAWVLVERDAPEDWKALARDASVFTFSPSGILEQDDTEVWTHVFRNLNHPLVQERMVPLDYRMGMERQPIPFPGPGHVYDGKFLEASARRYYRRWLDMMTGESGGGRR